MRFFALLAIVLAIPLAGACGGGDDDGGGGQAGGTEAAIEISETDFELDPATVELDEAGTYTFKAVNNGDSPHALEIEGNGVEEETETIEPGQSAELTVELAEGEYEMYCPVGDHEDRGMVGKVIVGGGGGAGTTETGETETGETETGETETGETETGETETDDSGGKGY